MVGERYYIRVHLPVRPIREYYCPKRSSARGGTYWKAYYSAHGTLHRAYLGKTSDLTLARLNEAAPIAGAKLLGVPLIQQVLAGCRS
jgi:hypothetical protein